LKNDTIILKQELVDVKQSYKDAIIDFQRLEAGKTEEMVKMQAQID
jgi:hypothetical protein